MNDQPLFEKQVLCDDCTTAAGPKKLSQGGKKVEKQENDVFHAPRG
jgi:hypothetical protein